MNYARYITPEEAIELGDRRSIKELRRLAKSKRLCMVCGQPAWKYAGQGMCFSCTTGESDPSGDYELVNA